MGVALAVPAEGFDVAAQDGACWGGDAATLGSVGNPAGTCLALTHPALTHPALTHAWHSGWHCLDRPAVQASAQQSLGAALVLHWLWALPGPRVPALACPGAQGTVPWGSLLWSPVLQEAAARG